LAEKWGETAPAADLSLKLLNGNAAVARIEARAKESGKGYRWFHVLDECRKL
jgi:hypothetical protein